MSSKLGTTLGATLGAALLGSLSLSQLASASPAFQAGDLAAGYLLAAAEGKCGEGKCGLKMMDTDKDGSVSFTEAAAAGMDRAYFDNIDSNGDGVLDGPEFDAHHAERHKPAPTGGAQEAKGAEGSCGSHEGAEGSCGSMPG